MEGVTDTGLLKKHQYSYTVHIHHFLSRGIQLPSLFLSPTRIYHRTKTGLKILFPSGKLCKLLQGWMHMTWLCPIAFLIPQTLFAKPLLCWVCRAGVARRVAALNIGQE